MKIGYAFSLSEKDMKNLFISSILHDIGKIGISDEILNKPDKLTENEYEIIKTHCKIGMDCLAKANMFNDVPNIVLYHHERYDGKGYPYGLCGNDIPFLSRIITLADCFDAMTSSRIYKKQMSISQAIKEVEKNSGTHFDSNIVNVLLKVINNSI